MSSNLAETQEICDCADRLTRYEPKVDTSTFYQTVNLPMRFEKPYLFRGYGIEGEVKNSLYRTSNSEYGWFAPSIHTVPQRYFPKNQEFSGLLGKCGMYRNYSLNTVMDRSFY